MEHSIYSSALPPNFEDHLASLHSSNSETGSATPKQQHYSNASEYAYLDQGHSEQQQQNIYLQQPTGYAPALTQHRPTSSYTSSSLDGDSSMLVSRESASGPSRQSGGGHQHRNSYSNGGGSTLGMGPQSLSTASGGRAGPYTRPDHNDHHGSTVKASSTTSEFTKRKNWSQHIIDEIQDFMHVLSPTGDVIFVSPSIRDLTGWTAEDLVGRPIAEFVHEDDTEGFLREFNASVTGGNDLNLYYRFRLKDDRYVIFEVAGHPYYVEEDGEQTCKCFFGMGRPYPSKNTAMLDSLLELKMENERLRQELQLMYKDVEAGQYGFGRDRRPTLGSPTSADTFFPHGGNSVIDPQTGLVQASGLLPSSSNMYGALGIGISNTGPKDTSGGDKKKKKMRADDGEFVCRDCGTVDSPEWRKGPEGPKSLCNACGLRYAKLKSKEKEKDKQMKAEGK